jgi:hypothetical protein
MTRYHPGDRVRHHQSQWHRENRGERGLVPFEEVKREREKSENRTNEPDPGAEGGGMNERILNPVNAADFEGKPVPERKWEVENYIPQHK